MSKKNKAKKSGRPALKEQSIQVELSDKKVKIIRRTNQVIEVINRGKAITVGEGKRAKKFKCNDLMAGQAKSVLKQIVSEKKLNIDVDKHNTRMLGKNVIAALTTPSEG